MPDKFVKYRSFNDKVLATELYGKLSEAGIPVAWEDTEGYFDASFSNNEFLNIYYVKLRKEDFKRVDELLLAAVSESKQEPIGDYYLFSFSNDEVLEVLKKPDEWNEFDLYWAKKILAARGVEIKEEEIERAKKERLDELKKPWILDKIWILCAFALLLISFAYLHIIWAFGGLFIGLYISFGKKTLPDGERVKAFSNGDRLVGKIVLVTGALICLFIFLYAFGFFGYGWFF